MTERELESGGGVLYEVRDGTLRKRSDYDPCGECLKGTCDKCDMCLLFETYGDVPGEPSLSDRLAGK